MLARFPHALGLVVLLLTAGSLGGCQISLGSASPEARAPEPSLDIGLGEDKLTVEELRAAVFAYAGQFYGAIAPAAGVLARKAENATDRLSASRARFYLMASVADIATSESPAAALLDMVVFARLNGLAWRSEGIDRWGENARPLADALTLMEKEAWALAARVLDTQQRKELREVIDEWRANHSGSQGVVFVRLSDFGDLGQKTALRQIRGSSGLLGQVQSALGQVDQFRATAERGIHFAKTAQIMLGIQFDMIVRELFAEPEMKSLFGLVSSAQVLAEKLAEQAEQLGSLPDALRKESTTLLDGAMARISEERRETIAQVMTELGRERTTIMAEAFRGVREEREATLEAAFTRVATLREKVTEDVRKLVREERIATLDDAFERITEQRRATFLDMRALVKEEREEVFRRTADLVSEERSAVLDRVDALGDKAFDRVRGLLFLGAGLLAGLILLVALLWFVGSRGGGRPAS